MLVRLQFSLEIQNRREKLKRFTYICVDTIYICPNLVLELFLLYIQHPNFHFLTLLVFIVDSVKLMERTHIRNRNCTWHKLKRYIAVEQIFVDNFFAKIQNVDVVFFNNFFVTTFLIDDILLFNVLTLVIYDFRPSWHILLVFVDIVDNHD